MYLTWEQVLNEIAFGNRARRKFWPEAEYIESAMTLDRNADPGKYPYADRHGIRFRLVKRTETAPAAPPEVWEPSEEDKAASDWTLA